MEQTQSSEIFSLSVEPITKAHLSEAAKWAKFLAIMGFIFCGLVAIVGIFARSMFATTVSAGEYEGAGKMAGNVVAIMYVVMGLIYFFPCLYLYRFASNTAAAMNSNAQEDLEVAFQNLKACFRFMGILAIILICFFVLGILISMIGLAAMG